MDPIANLQVQERILTAWGGQEPHAITQDGIRLRELREALTEWLTRGGFPPNWNQCPLAAPYFDHLRERTRAPMTFTIDTSGMHDIERSIAPPMAQAITVPVVAQMGARGAEAVLYICTSAFGQRGVPTSDRELKAITAEIVRRLAKE